MSHPTGDWVDLPEIDALRLSRENYKLIALRRHFDLKRAEIATAQARAENAQDNLLFGIEGMKRLGSDIARKNGVDTDRFDVIIVVNDERTGIKIRPKDDHRIDGVVVDPAGQISLSDTHDPA